MRAPIRATSRTRGRSPKREQFRDKPDEFFAKPSAIADVAFALAQQDRCTWAFDVVGRPFGEVW